MKRHQSDGDGMLKNRGDDDFLDELIIKQENTSKASPKGATGGESNSKESSPLERECFVCKQRKISILFILCHSSSCLDCIPQRLSSHKQWICPECFQSQEVSLYHSSKIFIFLISIIHVLFVIKKVLKRSMVWEHILEDIANKSHWTGEKLIKYSSQIQNRINLGVIWWNK